MKYFRVTIPVAVDTDTVGEGFIDNRKSTDFAITDLLSLSEEKERANMRFEEIIKMLALDTSAVDVSNIVVTGGDESSAPTQIEFTVSYEDDQIVYMYDKLNNNVIYGPASVGGTATEEQVIERIIANSLASSESFIREVYNPGRFGDSYLLNYNFLQDSSTPIDSVSERGPILTFTRDSNAMSFDSSGNLSYAPHQHCPNSRWQNITGELPAGWSTTDSGGKTYVDRGDYNEFTCVASNDRQHLYDNFAEAVASETYTIGCYIHSAINSGGSVQIIRASATNGTDGDVSQADFGTEGWYAVGFTMGAADTAADTYFGFGGAGNSTGTCVISRPFVVKGLLPGVGVNSPAKLSGEPLGRWIGTDDGDEPLYDQPRFEYDPVSGAPLGLLIEEARENVCLQSEDIASTWANQDSTDATNTQVAPDGNTTADTITNTHASNDGRVFINFASTAAAYTFSAFFKAGTSTDAFLEFIDQGSQIWLVDFDLSAVTATTRTGSPDDSGIRDVGNGWYRCYITVTFPSPGAADTQRLGNTGDNASTIHVWGMQTELSAFPTSYIPTTTVNVTRAKDVATIAISDVPEFSTTEAAFYIQWSTSFASTSAPRILQIHDNSESNDWRLLAGSSHRLTQDSGSSQVVTIIGSALSADTIYKSAFAAKLDDVALYLNGSQEGTDTSAAMPVGLTIITFGGDTSDARQINGHIQRLVYWPARKINNFLLNVTGTFLTTGNIDSSGPLFETIVITGLGTGATQLLRRDDIEAVGTFTIVQLDI